MSGRGLEVESTFDAITYWNHDADPSPFDHLPRWLEWCQLAPQLHAPLTAEKVDELVKASGATFDDDDEPKKMDEEK